MSDTVKAPQSMETETSDHASGHEHPSEKQYIIIALILAALTALEFGTYFSSVLPDFLNGLAIPILIILMVIKFYLVAAYFMHLKFDNPLLRRVFIAGIVLSAVVYFVMLQAFRFFSGFNTPV